MNGAIRNGSLKSMRRKRMSEYTYKDVIIDPEDPRVEIGKEYYFGDFPKEALEYANKRKQPSANTKMLSIVWQACLTILQIR